MNTNSESPSITISNDWAIFAALTLPWVAFFAAMAFVWFRA
jgi:hypothetical protein